MLSKFKEINKKRLQLVDESKLLKLTALETSFDNSIEIRKKQNEVYKKFKFYDGLLKELNKR